MVVRTASSPDPGALSGPLAGVSFVAGVAGAMALADLPYPRPGSDLAQIQRYFGQNAGPARLSAATLARRGFVAGGPVHAVGFGVLVGALGLAGLRSGELPRPLSIAGLASAGVSLLSPLYFVAEPAGWFIPAGRFSGLPVSGIAGARLAGGSC